MQVEQFLQMLKKAGIDTFAGVPDSTLSVLCAHLNQMDKKHHMCTVNEGAAVGVAAGHYLSTGKPACVYMQNSGLGNAINPMASLTHADVYEIPVLYLIGYRGKPGEKDEPQHVFQGRITLPQLDLMEIEHAVLSPATDTEEILMLMERCMTNLRQKKSFAFVIEKGTFKSDLSYDYQNSYTFIRESAIRVLAEEVRKEDVLVSTTGKISRELYEQLDSIKGCHDQAFLTVGSMGHASMIAAGMAHSFPEQRIICLDGDGAALMHMGSLAFIAQQQLKNFVHIVLNNGAHESVGGMPTSACELSIADVARSCGYQYAETIREEAGFKNLLQRLDKLPKPCMIEVLVSMCSRSDLGRPKETPTDNKLQFMKRNEVL
ncbi:MAG: phosphonopyruvate decarboxylase [Erysipelotrichaceae bacterium]|jgi:phosphonopyruvate decarboxylase|nr:phosphonopyruvate decarboxylase [Erysipelotrichaceae bacterium]